MPAVLDQMKDAAYTSVGVNLLVSDAVVSNVRKNRDEFLGRLGERGERVEKFLNDNELSTPEFLEDHAAKAREAATESLTDLRERLAPRTDQLVERLPERVGGAVDSSRNQMWDFLGIDAPKPKVAATAASSAKSASKTKTTKAKSGSKAKTTRTKASK